MNRLITGLGSRLDRVRREVRRTLTNLAPYDVLLISDGQGWALDDVAQGIADHLPRSLKTAVIDFVPNVSGKTLHFIDRYRFLKSDSPGGLAAHNRVIVTWWHGGASDLNQVHLDEMLRRVSELAHLPVTYHIASTLYREPLASTGVERIEHVPLGVDLGAFLAGCRPRAEARDALELPTDRRIIGYFQRDGDYHAPKLVKGPDVFVEAVARLHKERNDLLVLLTGPKRGYVMNELVRLGVPFRYDGIVPAEMVPLYYAASDLILVTSREEGGPKAIFEAMAAGTPLVSTRVGVAVDVIVDSENGFLTPIEDAQAIAAAALRLLADDALHARIALAGRQTVEAYDWGQIAPWYAERLYGSRL